MLKTHKNGIRLEKPQGGADVNAVGVHTSIRRTQRVWALVIHLLIQYCPRVYALLICCVQCVGRIGIGLQVVACKQTRIPFSLEERGKADFRCGHCRCAPVHNTRTRHSYCHTGEASQTQLQYCPSVKWERRQGKAECS